jgi:hypothetical protein
MPAIVISFVILLYIRYDGTECIVQTSSGSEMTSIDSWASTLSFLATISVTLVLRREGP